MNNHFLNNINSPDDIKKLNDEQISDLCDEIRSELIDVISKNGGHLASNLGVVELTVALHKNFNSPVDSILFDVGHQAYTHKLLTGRYSKFDTIRQKDGLSGFMRPDESEHDPFVTGHSSNAVSAMYGIYKAKRLQGDNSYCVVVVGDGALTGGMAFEGLNNSGGNNPGFIVVINDNKMSISKNIGGLARHLNKIRINPKYHSAKRKIKNMLGKIPLIGMPIFKLLFNSKNYLKNALYHQSNVFESLGFDYIGPVDGHDISSLSKAFQIAKMHTKPCVIHTVTVKGKGYRPAEKMPDLYHGVSSFDPDNGAKQSSISFSSVAGNEILRLAQSNDKICVVTAAMAENTGFSGFAKEYKNRFFDVGIAEQHAVTFCGGLAAGGMYPVFPVFSTFLQRGYDQLIHDISISGYKSLFLIDRAGIVGEDGATHQGIYDVSYITDIKNATLFSPCNYNELESTLRLAQKIDGPVFVRYPRGKQDDVLAEYKSCDKDFSLLLNDKNAPLVITYGRLYAEAIKALNKGANFNILKLNKIFPIPQDAVNIACAYDKVLFFEESIINGSISEKFGARMFLQNSKSDCKIFAINDNCVSSAQVSQCLSDLGLDCDSIIKAVNGEN